MSYDANVILVFTPSGTTLNRKKHGIHTINRVMERNGRGYFTAGKVGNMSWGFRSPMGIELYAGTFNHLSKEWLTRLIKRTAKCLPGNIQLFWHEAEQEGALLEEVFPKANAGDTRLGFGYGRVEE